MLALGLMIVPSTLASLTVSTSPSSVSLTQGSTYSGGSIVVQNTGNTTVRVTNLTWTSNTTHITTGFTSASAFDLAPSASQTVGVLMSLDNSIASGNYGVTFKASDNESNTSTGTMVITVPSAPVTDTGFHFGNGTINLGGQNQARGETITGKIHVNNDQNSSITNFAVHFTGSAAYNFQITSTVPSTVNPHQQFDILYSITVPDSQDSQKTKIGSIAYTSDSLAGSVDVYMTARSMLTIDDVNFQSDSGNDNNINPGDTISVSVKPGDSASFDIFARNLYSSADSIDMNNAQITVTIYNIDNGNDLTLDTNSFDIRYNDRQKESLDFTVPTGASEDTYQVVIEASAEDDNGATHYATETIYLKVNRQSHDLRLSNVQFTPLSVCQGSSATLGATTTNYGTNNEDFARLEVQGTNNNFAQAQNFAVNDYNSGDNTYQSSFNVPTSGLQPGTYNYQLKVYYSGSNFEDAKTVILLVQDCGNQNTAGNQSNGQPPVIVVQPTQPTTGQGSQGNTQTPTSQSTSTNQMLYTVLLIIGNLFIVLLIIWMIVRLFSK